MNTDRLWLRGVGLVVVLACLAIYDATAVTVLHRLVIPLALAAGAWALVQNVAAVAFGCSVLTVIHLDFRASDWISSVAYPAVAAVSTLILVGALVGRFKRRIQDTREARWANRDTR